MPNTWQSVQRACDSFLRACQSHRARATIGSLLLATLVAVLDCWTGDELPLIICYLPSVVVICWVSHLAVGVCVAMACCTLWLIDDLLFYETHRVTLPQFWTALSHFGFYLVIMLMLMRVRSSQAREEGLARTDSLTGLMNSKAFRENAERELERARRTGSPLAVAYVDCDNFKQVNDTQGHFAGDLVLKAVGETMQNTLRRIDLPARLGGDEFAILLPGTTIKAAKRTIERLRKDLTQRMQGHGWAVTFSIGVAVFESPPKSVDELIHKSDVLMLQVKRQRKDAIAYELYNDIS